MNARIVSDARALLHNLSGTQVLLEEGFAELGPVPVGGSARGSLGLSVSPSADPAVPVSFDLVVADVQLRESVRHKFDLAVLGNLPAFAPASEQLRVGADPVRLYNAANGKSPQLGEIPAGAQLDLLGRAGGWAAVTAGPGRRAWLPADLLRPGDGKGTTELPTRGFHLVQPPTLTLEPTSQVTRDDSIEVRGSASKPLGMSPAAFLRDYSLLLPGQAEANSRVYLRGQGQRSWFDLSATRYVGITATDTDNKILPTTHPVLDYFRVHDRSVVGGELSWRTSVVSLSREAADLAVRDPMTPITCDRTQLRSATNLNPSNCLVNGIDGTPLYNECMVQVEVQDKIKPACVPPANVTVACEQFDPSQTVEAQILVETAVEPGFERCARTQLGHQGIDQSQQFRYLISR